MMTLKGYSHGSESPHTSSIYRSRDASWKLGWYSRSEAEFQSVPLERRWVESGCELSTVPAALYAGRAWSFLLGTGTVALTTHLPISHRLNVRELTPGACNAIFKVTW